MKLEQWADLLDRAVRERTATRTIIVLPDDVARELADHLRAAAYLLDDARTGRELPEPEEN